MVVGCGSLLIRAALGEVHGSVNILTAKPRAILKQQHGRLRSVGHISRAVSTGGLCCHYPYSTYYVIYHAGPLESTNVWHSPKNLAGLGDFLLIC